MPNMKVRLEIALAAFALLVCGLSHAANDQVRVIPESSLTLWWQPDPATPNQMPKYPLEALQKNVEGCVSVAFEIQGGGSVSNERVWHSVFTSTRSNKLLEQASLLAVHKWHFSPAAANTGRAAIYTYHIFTYTISGPRPTANDARRAKELESQCDMSHFVQQMQSMVDAAARTKGGKP